MKAQGEAQVAKMKEQGTDLAGKMKEQGTEFAARLQAKAERHRNFFTNSTYFQVRRRRSRFLVYISPTTQAFVTRQSSRDRI